MNQATLELEDCCGKRRRKDLTNASALPGNFFARRLGNVDWICCWLDWMSAPLRDLKKEPSRLYSEIVPNCCSQFPHMHRECSWSPVAWQMA